MPAAREKRGLIEKHLALVQAIARKVKKTLSASIDFEDLVGYGSKGLVEAAERFDPTQGVTFSTFAYYRIRGAMFDGLRTMGWYSRVGLRALPRRGARQRVAAGARRARRRRAERGGAPAGGGQPRGEGPGDTAATLASIGEILSEVATVHITSLEAAATVADESLPAPDALIDTGRLSVRLRGAIQTLPDARAAADGALLLRRQEPRGGGRDAWACRSRGPAGCTRARSSSCARAMVDDK